MKRVLVVGLGAVVLGFALWVPSSSEACGHVMVLAQEDAAVKVVRAERWLAEGRPGSAYVEARRARRQLEQRARESGADANTTALLQRTWDVTAVAVARLDGRVPGSRRDQRYITRGREERSLSWAVEQLRARVQANPNAPRARMHLAEALARMPAHRDEARAILVDLAERDLMVDPHGYAMLSRLSEPASERWQLALTRCQRMASENATRVCPAASALDS